MTRIETQMPAGLRRFADFLAANPSPVNVEAGKFYMVPCAKLPERKWRDHLQYVPLLGTVHEDRDIVDFQPWHIHLDTRFVTMLSPFWFDNYLGSPLCLTGNGFSESLQTWDTPNEWGDAELLVHRLRARSSEPPEYPTQMATFFPKLEDAYASCRVANGLCPHRKFPLAAGRDMGYGVRQCPGHGLCWDTNGAMVRRAAMA